MMNDFNKGFKPVLSCSALSKTAILMFHRTTIPFFRENH